MPVQRASQITVLLLVILVTGAELGRVEGDEFRATEHFKKAMTIEEAIDIMHAQLRTDRKPEYVGLLSSARTRAAIKTAVQSYEVNALAVSERRFPGTRQHFEDNVKPVMLKIADDGIWPEGCSIHAYYRLVEKRGDAEITYEGIGVGIQIETPTAKYKGFALPILTVFYGRIEQEKD